MYWIKRSSNKTYVIKSNENIKNFIFSRILQIFRIQIEKIKTDVNKDFILTNVINRPSIWSSWKVLTMINDLIRESIFEIENDRVFFVWWIQPVDYWNQIVRFYQRKQNKRSKSIWECAFIISIFNHMIRWMKTIYQLNKDHHVYSVEICIILLLIDRFWLNYIFIEKLIIAIERRHFLINFWITVIVILMMKNGSMYIVNIRSNPMNNNIRYLKK